MPLSQQQAKTLIRLETAACTSHQHFQAFGKVSRLKSRKRWRHQGHFRHRILALVSLRMVRQQQVLIMPGGSLTALYQHCLLPRKSGKKRTSSCSAPNPWAQGLLCSKMPRKLLESEGGSSEQHLNTSPPEKTWSSCKQN